MNELLKVIKKVEMGQLNIKVVLSDNECLLILIVYQHTQAVTFTLTSKGVNYIN